MDWIDRVADNILPLSESDNVADALKEWVYTGNCFDLGTPVETCQLCDHPDIRYQFVILNEETDHTLLIGSECIKRFGISAIDKHGNILDDEATRTKVNQDRNRLITEGKRRRMMNTLVQLASADEKFDIQDFIDYFDDRGAFTPNQLSFLFWRLQEARITCQKSDFKMTIKRKREKEQLAAMPEWKFKKIAPAMTDSQVTWYLSNR